MSGRFFATRRSESLKVMPDQIIVQLFGEATPRKIRDREQLEELVEYILTIASRG